ncbi:Peptidyl-tRNA hydrolase [bacterium HR21]|jgi:PTH1 family peptidyl-tRNA hydrolase|nr:Peptidyl-tRNA hydrolase [bacterium HR21]
MSTPEWLIVGLGNPGPEYAATRHNIGWMVVQAFVERHGGRWQKGSGPWLEAPLSFAGHSVLAVLPLTFMNRSGEAVRAVQQRTGIPTERIVVVLDELNFPLGRVHLKATGSDGGHNGMASVLEALGTRHILRLRCGIGRNFPPGGMVQYVLSPFTSEEVPERDRMIEQAVSALEYLVRYGPARAMPVINSGALAEAQRKPTASSP